jgi:hypothetical protein
LAGTTQTVRCEVFDGIATSIDDVALTLEAGQVTDTVKPVITLLGPSVVNVIVGDDYIDQGATANDNVDGDISNLLQISDNVNTNAVGTYSVSYNITDTAGNSADEVTRTVNVTESLDATKPTITLLGQQSVSVNYGDIYTDSGATAFDAVDGDITSRIVILNPVNTAIPGLYSVTYNVSDLAGNQADEVVREVTVLPLSVESTLNAELEGIADGTYLTRVVDTDNNALLFKENKAWSGGVATFTLPVMTGTNVEYYVYETDSDGAGLQIGVTE